MFEFDCRIVKVSCVEASSSFRNWLYLLPSEHACSRWRNQCVVVSVKVWSGKAVGKQRNGVPPRRWSCRKEERFGGKEASRVCQFLSIFTAEVNRHRPDTSFIWSVCQYSQSVFYSAASGSMLLHSLTRSLTQSLARSFNHSLAHSLNHSLIQSLAHSHTHTHTHTQTLDSREFLFLLHEINSPFVGSHVTVSDLAKTVLHSAYVFYLWFI